MKKIQTGIEMSLLSFAVTRGGFVGTAWISICRNLNPFARKPVWHIVQPFAAQGKKAIDFTDWFLAKS